MNRLVRSLVCALALFFLMSATTAPRADAARGWCRVDPIIMVDGQLADVYIGSSLDMLLQATGPLQLEIVIPNGSIGFVILNDVGFLHGYNVVFTHSSALTRTSNHTQIQARVYAPAQSSDLPVTVTIAPRALFTSTLKEILIGTSLDGYANNWVTLTTR
jgi:hypothetical protein